MRSIFEIYLNNAYLYIKDYQRWTSKKFKEVGEGGKYEIIISHLASFSFHLINHQRGIPYEYTKYTAN